MAESSSVQSLDRAFDLLELLCKSRNGMSIGALSAETGLHKSTVHRLLSSMCTRGYVQRDAATSIYHAGMRLCELSSFIMDNLDVVERARLADGSSQPGNGGDGASGDAGGARHRLYS